MAKLLQKYIVVFQVARDDCTPRCSSCTPHFRFDNKRMHIFYTLQGVHTFRYTITTDIPLPTKLFHFCPPFRCCSSNASRCFRIALVGSPLAPVPTNIILPDTVSTVWEGGLLQLQHFTRLVKTKCTVRKRVCLRAISELIPFWAKIPGNSVAQGISPEEASK